MRIFLIATLLIALQTLLIGAHAQTYPAKSVRIIASVLPGDTCDILVRMLGYKMGDRLGQQFVIDNRAGASGQLGHALVAQAAPDGYTLGCGNGGSLSIVPHVFKNVPYNALKDFTPVALMATNFMALAVGNTHPAKNAGELIQMAKQNPGKVSFGSNGEGAFLHFATEWPAGIPPNIVALLNSEANRAINLPDIREKIVSFALDAVTESSQHFASYMRAEHARYGKIAKEIGLKAQ